MPTSWRRVVLRMHNGNQAAQSALVTLRTMGISRNLRATRRPSFSAVAKRHPKAKKN
jgi:hypothetical protein